MYVLHRYHFMRSRGKNIVEAKSTHGGFWRLNQVYVLHRYHFMRSRGKNICSGGQKYTMRIFEVNPVTGFLLQVSEAK